MIKLALLLISTAAIPKESLSEADKVMMILPDYPCTQAFQYKGYVIEWGRIKVRCESGKLGHYRIYRL